MAMPGFIDPHATVIGFVVGLLIGTTGMGGASLMTPLLILVLGVRPTVAVGTDLVYASLTKALGTTLHARQGTVDRGTAARIAAGSIPGWSLARSRSITLPAAHRSVPPMPPSSACLARCS